MSKIGVRKTGPDVSRLFFRNSPVKKKKLKPYVRSVGPDEGSN
jgi:hypothetical protein